MSLKKINVAVIGATGYVGLDLVFLLSKHPNVKISYLCAQKKIGKQLYTIDKRQKKQLPKISSLTKILWDKIDLVFLSLPNGEAQKIVKKFHKYNKVIFIDLSADFRLENSVDFKKWYLIKHKAKELIKKTIYSIPEFTKFKIKNYNIIANPGCYPTSIQLVLNPLIKNKLININNIIIDSKSGYSGAGKNLEKRFKHKNLYSSIFAYNVNKHRHMAEIDQEFKKLNCGNIKYTFNTHLLPTFRGILSSIYLELKSNIKIKNIHNHLVQFHKKNKFIKILKMNSEIGTGDVINTNKCQISVCESRYKNRIVIFSALDNLVKGASGQAIQNMNLLYNYKENQGLK